MSVTLGRSAHASTRSSNAGNLPAPRSGAQGSVKDCVGYRNRMFVPSGSSRAGALEMLNGPPSQPSGTVSTTCTFVLSYTYGPGASKPPLRGGSVVAGVRWAVGVGVGGTPGVGPR